MVNRRAFLWRSVGAAGALAVRWALPITVVAGRVLSNVARYGSPPFMRLNLLTNFYR